MRKKRRCSDITDIYNPRDKVASVNYYIDNMLNRTLTMFEYENLPESIPERELELILQVNGYGIITEHKGELLALWGGFAPPLNAYYMYENVLVNNPWVDINQEFTIEKEKDAVLIRNDPLNTGMMPILKKFSALNTEADLTLYLAMVNHRAIYAIGANSDREKESGDDFLRKIENGEQGVLLGDKFSESLKTLPFSTSSGGYITQLIELEQYLRATFFHEIGLNSNYNMKRERLSESEIGLNEDALRSLIDSMLEERQKAIEKVNKKYGTNISVRFSNAWGKYNKTEIVEEVEDEKDDNGNNAELTD